MRGRAIRFIVLLWLGWYLSGPLAAIVDKWDGPQQEWEDLQFNAGGGAVLIAAVFCLAVLLAKKYRERFLSPHGNVSEAVVSILASGPLPTRWLANLEPNRSPPFPIRI